MNKQEDLSMDDKIKRIIESHLKEKKGSNYVRPLLTDSESLPYYHDQEQTYTDLTQMDTTHGPSTLEETNQKSYVLPDESTYNPDWADGDFSSPKVNQPQRDFNKTPNTPETLYDPAIDGDGVNQLSVQSFFNEIGMEDLKKWDYVSLNDLFDKYPLVEEYYDSIVYEYPQIEDIYMDRYDVRKLKDYYKMNESLFIYDFPPEKLIEEVMLKYQDFLPRKVERGSNYILFEKPEGGFMEYELTNRTIKKKDRGDWKELMKTEVGGNETKFYQYWANVTRGPFYDEITESFPGIIWIWLSDGNKTRVKLKDWLD